MKIILIDLNQSVVLFFDSIEDLNKWFLDACSIGDPNDLMKAIEKDGKLCLESLSSFYDDDFEALRNEGLKDKEYFYADFTIGENGGFFNEKEITDIYSNNPNDDGESFKYYNRKTGKEIEWDVSVRIKKPPSKKVDVNEEFYQHCKENNIERFHEAFIKSYEEKMKNHKEEFTPLKGFRKANVSKENGCIGCYFNAFSKCPDNVRCAQEDFILIKI